MNHGMCFCSLQDFLAYSSGVYEHVIGDMLGAHSAKLIGWGVDQDQNLPYWLAGSPGSSFSFLPTADGGAQPFLPGLHSLSVGGAPMFRNVKPTLGGRTGAWMVIS